MGRDEREGSGRPADNGTPAGHPSANGHPHSPVGDEGNLEDYLRAFDDGFAKAFSKNRQSGRSKGNTVAGVRQRQPLPIIRLIAAPTGAGKSEAAAQHVAKVNNAIVLADRHESIEQFTATVEKYGGSVGRVLPLDGKNNGIPNCLHPDIVGMWQMKGYSYRAGFCPNDKCCKRQGKPEACPFLASIDALEEAPTIAATKALGRSPGFFHSYGNQRRDTVIIDEDPIGMLRPLVEITRHDLTHYLKTITRIVSHYRAQSMADCEVIARHYEKVASWLWGTIQKQEPNTPLQAIDIPTEMVRIKSSLPKKALKCGKQAVDRLFRKLMRRDPYGTVRNVTRDLVDLKRAAGKVVFANTEKVIFHIRVGIPRGKRVFILDATANVDLLRPLFPGSEIEVLCDDRVRPAGRVVQFMDFNGPRSYLNKHPKKLIRIIDAIGDLYSAGTIVLISHASCVEELKKASRHADRIRTAYFGALRGRNDLEHRREDPIACHIVAGSPKTTEEDRQQLALAVYGRKILPFPELQDVRRAVTGRLPPELVDGEEELGRLWEVKIKGYLDASMQAIYDHTVTAELTHAADRARVLTQRNAAVYLVTNEPCPRLWFAEKCYATDLLDLSETKRADYAENYRTYEDKARELLNKGEAIGNADVCRALKKKNAWGWRYWQQFLARYEDALEGRRKMRWKKDGEDEG